MQNLRAKQQSVRGLSFDKGRVEPTPEGFLRDTLVFRTGKLARTALRVAFSDPRMQAVYAAWLSAPAEPLAGGALSSPAQEPEYQTLMEAGIERGGTVVVQARKKPEEFVLTCEHPDFELVVCVAFAPRTARMHGFHVVVCSGKPKAALAWLDETTARLQRLVGAAGGDSELPPRDRMN